MRVVTSIKNLLMIASVQAIIFSVLPAYAGVKKSEGIRVMVAGLNVRTGLGTKYRRVGIIHKNVIYMTTYKKKGKWNQMLKKKLIYKHIPLFFITRRDPHRLAGRFQVKLQNNCYANQHGLRFHSTNKSVVLRQILIAFVI